MGRKIVNLSIGLNICFGWEIWKIIFDYAVLSGGLSAGLQIGLQIRVRNWKLLFLFLNQTYVVGTQKNRLNETVLLSTQNIC